MQSVSLLEIDMPKPWIPIKQMGDYRNYPYPPTSDELAAELAAERCAHAETKRKLAELRAKNCAISMAYLSLHRKKSHVSQVLAALRDAGEGARIVHPELPN